MRLTSIDPHSHKEQAKLYKIPKFGVNRPNSKQDTAIRKCQNLQRNVWPILTFLNRSTCISAKTSLINTKLGEFVIWCALSDYVDQ